MRATEVTTPELDYPFGKKWSPAVGEPYEVVDGVYWLRSPLPMALDHINLWLLKDGDHWIIVDCGFDYPQAKAIWARVFSEFCQPSQIKQIVVTHYHPDHIGLAAWLSHRCDAKVSISVGEFNGYRALIDRDHRVFTHQLASFGEEMGFDRDQTARYIEFMRSDDKPDETRLHASQVEFIKAGDRLRINNRDWHIVHGNGHSPEHSCLYCPELGALISGDQAIARISSNISVYPSTRDQNPLKNWFDSCRHLQTTIPPTTLVLPAHQEPFIGIGTRMQQLIDGHHAQLDLLTDIIATKSINVPMARRLLFNRELNTIETLFATVETLAHLNYLEAQQSVVSHHDQRGLIWFSLANPT